MDIYLKDKNERRLLDLQSHQIQVDGVFCQLQFVLQENESPEVWMNDVLLDRETLADPFFAQWDQQSTCRVQVKLDKKNLLFELLNDTLSIVPDDVWDNLVGFQGDLEDHLRIGVRYSLEQFEEFINKGEISILHVKKPFTGFNNEGLLERIKLTVPMIMDICSHPKISLRTEEAVLDVNLVKRINSNTLQHLSSHSEHWKTRTLNGLIPKRLKTDILEDEINIYENLFFRMAIQDILQYTVRQVSSLRQTIKENQRVISWSQYGNELKDYRRIRVLKRILPKFDSNEKSDENIYLEALLKEWTHAMNLFSNVEASSFYRSIDRKKRISRNVHMTNILKKDSRYNALYRLWCLIRQEEIKEQQEKEQLSKDENFSAEKTYFNYTVALLAFGLVDEDLLIDQKESYLLFNKSGELSIQLKAIDSSVIYRIATSSMITQPRFINIEISEKVDFSFAVPENISLDEESLNGFDNLLIFNEKEHELHFVRKPTNEEQNRIRNIFNVKQIDLNKKSKQEQLFLKNRRLNWNKFIETIFSSGILRDSYEETIRLIPVFLYPKVENEFLYQVTDQLFNYSHEHTFYILPMNVALMSNVSDPVLARRLVNYGEMFDARDASHLGNYQTGIIPISQQDFYSAQRLKKLLFVYKTVNLMRWHNGILNVCPVCGGQAIHQLDSDTWVCDDNSCGVHWGKTRCVGKCKSEFYWIKPGVEITAKDYDSSSEMSEILSKETLFDRLAITDFEFQRTEPEKIHYVPVCPKCGYRRFDERI